ncbi:antibiotic biosynthesis monooxygenase [Blastococcus sp. SYSU DS0539]
MPLRLRTRLGGIPTVAEHEPVTVTVARVVRPDRRIAFERAAAAVLAEAANYPGNLGATLLHPGADSSEYHLVYRFADADALAGWERSPERRAFLARMPEMVEDERVARAVGLENFFAVPAKPGPAWRSWLLTVAVVLLFTSSFQVLALPLVGSWPWPLRLLLSAAYVVTALRLLMPRLSRWLGRWLQGSRR